MDADSDATDSPISGVVVGFDGSTASIMALDWGAQAASTHGLALTLLAAQPDAEGDILEFDDEEDADLVDEDIAETLEAALERVSAQYPDLEVKAVVHPDAPVVGILEASETADVVVLGSRGLGGFKGLLLGSTTMNVTPYAACPVVVLYEPDEDTVEARANARHPNEVVVGFDGSVYAERALVFALEHAKAAGLGVAVVVVSRGRGDESPVVVTPGDESLKENVREQIDAAAEIAKDYPDVAVAYLHGVGRPAGVLIEEAAGAALAVVGVRGRGGFSNLLLGSVGLQMLIHAECPVAIVRESHALPGE